MQASHKDAPRWLLMKSAMMERLLTCTVIQELSVLHRLHAHVSNIGQLDIFSTCNCLRMNGEIEILAVELDGKDGLVVTFSDGTTGGYVVEELTCPHFPHTDNTA